MKNRLVSEILFEIADLLDIKGEIFFKTRAYRMAAQTIETLDEDIEIISKENRLQNIPGIGEALAKKIKEIVDTGKLEYLDKLKKEIPEGLLKFLEIPGLGPKKVSAIYKNFNITTIEELKKACKEGKLRNLDGFGQITEENILRGINLKEKTSGRFMLNLAYDDGEGYLKYLKKSDKIDKVSIAGSLRRMKETIGDLDILASSRYPDDVMNYFVKYRDVKSVLLQGSTKTSVLLKDDLQVDLRVVDNSSYGAALQYFTGSKEHNVKLRSIAIKKGFKLNEYGVFDKKTDKYIVGKEEEEVYKKLGLKFIEPELRENQGEIEAAEKNSLPKLVKNDEIKGDFHVHSNYSDGFETIENIAKNAQRLGYEYVCIDDHSQSLKVANGLSEKRVLSKIKEIEKINKKLKNLKVLCGTECDIKPDGSLDYPDSILKKFDIVGIGIHTTFKMTKDEITKRVVKGMENKNVDFLAHPTCRLIGRREPFDLDIESVFDAAKQNDVLMEINCFPDRLDLNDMHIKMAKEKGISFVLGTDSHSLEHMNFMKFGVATARRGWLEKKDILNTYSLKEVEKKLGL